MTEIATIIDELQRIHDGDAWHGASLKDNLTGVTAEQAAAKPIAAGHSIWELVLHIAAWEGVLLNRLNGQSTGEPEEGDFPAITDTSENAWLEAQARMNNKHRQLVESLSRVTAAQLDEPAVGMDRSLRFVLHGYIRHHVYHAGQIALLRKAG
jgi:uncharacterized damage-inducible protein DinB